MEIIKINQLSKKYLINKESNNETFREALIKTPINLFKKQRKEYFWALNNINISIFKGDRIGIIGRNGAGKSTLLKILSRITYPSKGIVKIRGKVSSLLEVGTGFHSELTGKENIFLNGSLLGMKRDEIINKFDEIVSFAGVDKFLNTPVKRYSTGMRVRLAFSVAAHLEPDIFIIDEVLAVGDIEFQKKCLGKMKEVSENGRTIIFVSHDLQAISALTNKCILLEKGKLIGFDDTEKIIKKYLETNKDNTHVYENKNISNKKIIEFVKTKIKRNNDKNLECEIIYNVNQDVGSVISIVIHDIQGRAIITTRDTDINSNIFSKKKGRYITKFTIPSSIFKPNKYLITFSAADMKSIRFDYLREVLTFDSELPDFLKKVKIGDCSIILPIKWETKSV